MRDFAKWLKDYLERNNLSPNSFENKGVSQSTINSILTKGKCPTEQTIKKIYDALGVSMADLDDPPILKRAYELANTMDLDDKRKEALEKIKALPDDEQQERLNRSIEKLKSLPPKS